MAKPTGPSQGTEHPVSRPCWGFFALAPHPNATSQNALQTHPLALTALPRTYLFLHFFLHFQI